MQAMSSRHEGRSVVLLAGAIALVAAVVFGFGLSGCGSEAGSEPPSGPDSLVVLTVEQALQAEPGQDLKVEGYVVSVGGEIVLSSALAESMPPQAAGAVVPLADLDLTRIVGLSITVGRPEMAEATWSDFPVVLTGAVANGVFAVQEVPSVEEAVLDGIRVRFSPVSEPISSGDDVWWAMDVGNTGRSAVDLTFSSGQRGDVTLVLGGEELYAWSEGKAFDQALQTVALEPGTTFPVVLNDTLDVPPATYELKAWVTAVVGSGDTAAPLPSITYTLTVH